MTAKKKPVPAYLQPGYVFSVGWPRGYDVPGVSPYDTEPSRADKYVATMAAKARGGALAGAKQATSQITENMRSGGLEHHDRGRGTLAIGKRSADALKIQRTAKGTLG